MKRTTIQVIAIIVLCLAICFAGCAKSKTKKIFFVGCNADTVCMQLQEDIIFTNLKVKYSVTGDTITINMANK